MFCTGTALIVGFVKKNEKTGLCIVNGCAVTHLAAKKTKIFVVKLLDQNPDTKIVITGCITKADAKDFMKLGISIVENKDKQNLVKNASALGLQ